MNRVRIPKSEDGGSSSSNGGVAGPSSMESPNSKNLTKEETADEQGSQDDMKSETGTGKETGVFLREKRTRKRPSHLDSPDSAPAPVLERRVSVRAEKSGMNGKVSDMSNWLQCDMCRKWRLVHSNVFADLKKLAHFQCRNLQGVTCKDRDDWGAGGSLGSEDDNTISRRNVRNNRRVNIFAGKYIPGFAAEFSDLDD